MTPEEKRLSIKQQLAEYDGSLRRRYGGKLWRLVTRCC